MIVIGIILIILAIIAFYYSIELENAPGILFVISIISSFLAIILIIEGTKNLNFKEKEIKNVKYYNIKSTIIIEDNITTDTIYTIYYKKK